MKSKIFVLCAMVSISLSLFACSSALKQVSVEASCDDFMNQKHISKQIEVSVDASLTVTLCSNPTTGFQWSEAVQISNQTVVKQADHKFVAPESTGVVGATGKDVWAFKALKKGTTTISMDYSRPWEGGEKGEWTYYLTVVVK